MSTFPTSLPLGNIYRAPIGDVNFRPIIFLLFSCLTFRQPRPQQPRNLLDQRVRRQKGIVLLRQLLDELLVLIQLLQVVGRHGVDAMVLRAVNVVLVAENALYMWHVSMS